MAGRARRLVEHLSDLMTIFVNLSASELLNLPVVLSVDPVLVKHVSHDARRQLALIVEQLPPGLHAQHTDVLRTVVSICLSN